MSVHPVSPARVAPARRTRRWVSAAAACSPAASTTGHPARTRPTKVCVAVAPATRLPSPSPMPSQTTASGSSSSTCSTSKFAG
ncbi:hypothetical protein [Micromonospora sp. NPDC049240]|uniref:hypothetical protein n=1 Tax=Micromonospora sp. NPDC049240 TaxID=3155151 RepID=UPI0033E9604B